MQKIVIGTRGSILALWQANFVKDAIEKKYKNMQVDLKIVKTKGDKILDVPLAKIGGKGLFTKELEELILKGEIDLAVHSLKDVPIELIDGLGLVAITQREDVRDSFLSEKYDRLEALPKGAKVGTTSLRRMMQIKNLRDDLDMQSLRGNVQTRLKRLKEGSFDAIILAQAAINRLKIQDNVEFIQSLDFMVPAMGQAALGIECKIDSKVWPLLYFLNDKKSLFETTCEREFVRILNGGCQIPLGIYAQLQENKLFVEAILGLPDGTKIIKDSFCGTANSLIDASNIGVKFALEFIKKGAKEILKQAQEWEF